MFVGLSLSHAQPKHFDADNLSVKLTLVSTDYQHKTSEFLFEIANNGKQTFPADGWTIYFNSNISKYESPELKFERINGDFDKFYPTDKFNAIAAGSSIQIRLKTNREMDNFTEIPSGFYIVWNDEPEKGYNLKFESKYLPIVQAKNLVVAAADFTKNTVVKDISETKLTKIFPTPQNYTETSASYTITPSTVIFTDKAFENEANLFASDLESLLEKLVVKTNETGKGIVLEKNASVSKEGYKLSVTNDHIKIIASTPAGAFYALQSLKTLIDPKAWQTKQASLLIKGVDVIDQPRFGFRGFMMDVARNFQNKQQVLKVLDVLSLYKMNVLHFHLNDDEGWRVEIPTLPELTEVGSNRGQTTNDKKNLVPSYGSGAQTGLLTGSGYYSKADFIEILKYATARHITVIPEIETPGHARAAIKSMDARYERLMKEGKKEEAERFLLRDLNDKSTYRSVQNWSDNVIDVALPSTYTFLETVVDDLVKMYAEAGAPLQTIHFGGDEVPRGVWEKSPAVLALMKQNESVKSIDDLWYYYFDRINSLLKQRNLYLSGWEEIGMRKVRTEAGMYYIANPDFANENFHTDVWNNVPGTGNEDLAYRLANAGYKVVLTCVTNFYLDLAYNKNFDEIGQNWGGYVDINKPFDFIPFDYLKNMKEDDRGNPLNRAIIKGKVPLTETGKQNIIGIQAPLWSEVIKSKERFEYLLFPKLLGVAERAWSKDPEWATENDAPKAEQLYNQAWNEFVNIMGKRELPRLNYYAGGFQYRIPTAGAITKNGKVEANVQIPGLIIRYTTDGTEPTSQSKIYSAPITLKKSVILKVFNSEGRSGNSLKIE
ncbi:N-acetyl-beta-hexosaminidase [Solitalea canadensis DSM 3403]|uniref:beta-N-acetylhexosaminidase n=2 Tax=Solitalea canadensis TaxID=995 RepID=H8KV34_SOLCM|nr:N-acetyl-beta-hexosaminidase [Solitalea canadensis DSM 3403]